MRSSALANLLRYDGRLTRLLKRLETDIVTERGMEREKKENKKKKEWRGSVGEGRGREGI
jgi:hypothetical protein